MTAAWIDIDETLAELKCMSRGFFTQKEPGALLKMKDGSYRFGKFLRKDSSGIGGWQMNLLNMPSHKTTDVCQHLANVFERDTKSLSVDRSLFAYST